MEKAGIIIVEHDGIVADDIRIRLLNTGMDTLSNSTMKENGRAS